MRSRPATPLHHRLVRRVVLSAAAAVVVTMCLPWLDGPADRAPAPDDALHATPVAATRGTTTPGATWLAVVGGGAAVTTAALGAVGRRLVTRTDL